MWVDHGVVAGAEVAGVLTGAGRDAVAVLAAHVALVVAHLVLPVVAAPPQARRWTVCSGAAIASATDGRGGKKKPRVSFYYLLIIQF